ncbi:uncharacterized protein EV154DRAFT_26970 [Mucor mucedo]|uniref:uncharacterized protein n=1 Tax=Mucor mucedo TaxID=29922 RepID=UPI00221E9662|nr:uncharacterized protein EV154DRAFT_26970 [Mucor mucedo]KAI7884444.1 hypothetical protein EV154DRAFT_26970 [Mucor mucedo]
MMFWLDCVVSLFSTIWFGVTWFVYTDHSLSDSSAKDPEALAEHERLFKMESQVSIAVLVLLRLIHFYFAIIVTRYYKAVNSKLSYSRVASDNIDLEETTNGRDASPKPAQD